MQQKALVDGDALKLKAGPVSGRDHPIVHEVAGWHVRQGDAGSAREQADTTAGPINGPCVRWLTHDSRSRLNFASKQFETGQFKNFGQGEPYHERRTNNG